MTPKQIWHAARHAYRHAVRYYDDHDPDWLFALRRIQNMAAAMQLAAYYRQPSRLLPKED